MTGTIQTPFLLFCIRDVFYFFIKLRNLHIIEAVPQKAEEIKSFILWIFVAVMGDFTCDWTTGIVFMKWLAVYIYINDLAPNLTKLR